MDEESKTDNLMDAAWIKRLFRRCAQKLHPDQERDPDQRELKQEQMAALLQARDDDDLLRLLQIYDDTLAEYVLRECR